MPEPVCDLVLLSWNHLEETRPCLESLVASTQVPVRLLIVDNGSAPEVRQFLASVKPRGTIQEVVLLQNETNEGFSRGMNRGMQTSRAPFVCLLNNDLTFTTGWLEEMLEVARAHPEVGIVNPASNNFGNRPPSGVSIEEHAASLKSLHGQYTEVGMGIGFCLLVRREVLNRLGGLTEEVERIFFEDEDFSMRAQGAGYRCVVAEASYVYHAEHRTVRKMPEREALFATNQRWCNEKWGRWVRMVWPRFDPVVAGSTELRGWLEQLLTWTRRRVHVYVYCPNPVPAPGSSGQPPHLTKTAVFRSVGLVPHVDIHWHPVPSRLVRWAATGYIVKRRKKPFDLIVAPDDRWARMITRLRWLHRAEVIPESDEEGLTRQWQRQSRTPVRT